MKPRLLLIVAIGLIPPACSDSEAGSDSADGLDPAELVLHTDTRGEDAVARTPFTVDCRLFKKAPAGSDEGAVGDELSLPEAATVVVTDGPAPPRHVAGTKLILGAAGDYRVACKLPAKGMQDDTPALLPVLPGKALTSTIRTRLWHHIPGQGRVEVPGDEVLKVQAGAFADATCAGRDEVGNEITAGWKLSFVGNVPADTKPGVPFQLTKASKVSVRCGVDGVFGPARSIEVAVGPPKRLYAILNPETITAGGASELSCKATDAYDNAVAGFPFSISHSDKVKLKGLYITSTVAGVHAVKCVPESLPWKLFDIHPGLLKVLPGPADSLGIARVPDQGVYKRKTKVRFHPLVKDEFDNVISDAKVTMAITKPKTGFKTLANKQDDWHIQFNEDATYHVYFEVGGTALSATSEVLIDGAPPLLTIDYPPWGSTLSLKPSIQLKGKAGDEGAGIKDLFINGIKSYPDAADDWFLQVGARHGLNPVLAVATDIGGQQTKATRGFYYSDKYYPTDASKPTAHLVPSAVQLFMGRDFFDDGVHDHSKPDDLATIIEIIAAGMPLSSVLPPNMNSSGADVKLSNAKMGKPKVALVCHDGGLEVRLTVKDISVDVKVKAKLKLGPIKTSIGASGTFSIGSAEIQTLMKLGVHQGKATAETAWTKAKINQMKFDIDGIGKLFNPIANAVLGAMKGELEKTLAKELQKELPKAFQALFDAMAINDTFEIDPLLPGQKGKDGKPKKITITLASKVSELTMTKKGALTHLDMGFSAAKGVPHKVLGAIGRGGCVGVEPDKFHIDEKARIQFAAHDDLINQLLYAIWYGGALSGVIEPGQLENQEGSGIPLETATVTVDLLLPPIIEGCPQVDAFNPSGKAPGDFDPMRLRLQLGDAMGAIDVYSNELVKLHMALHLELGFTLSHGKDDKGKPALVIQPDKKLTELHELVGLSKQLQEGKWAWIKATDGLFGALFGKGLSGLDKPIFVPLPVTEIDLKTIAPQLPGSSVLKIKVAKIARKAGYGAFTLALQ